LKGPGKTFARKVDGQRELGPNHNLGSRTKPIKKRQNGTKVVVRKGGMEGRSRGRDWGNSV